MSGTLRTHLAILHIMPLVEPLSPATFKASRKIHTIFILTHKSTRQLGMECFSMGMATWEWMEFVSFLQLIDAMRFADLWVSLKATRPAEAQVTSRCRVVPVIARATVP
jgi:hypothetical protein